MPTTIAVRFLLGRYHATPWATHVNEGDVEMPPAPWRLLRAFYATWRERLPTLEPAIIEPLLGALAAALPSYDVPAHTIAHTRHYYPDFTSTSSKKSSDQAYDAFAALDPDQPLLITWPLDLPDDQRHALELICKALPYLGRADSICEAELMPSVDADLNIDRPGYQHWRSDTDDQPPSTENGPGKGSGEFRRKPLAADDPSERRRLLAPTTPLSLEALITRTIDWRRRGLLYPIDSHLVDYRLITDPPTRTSLTSELGAQPGRRRRRLSAQRSTEPNPEITVVRFDIGQPVRPSYLDTVITTDILHNAAARKLSDHRTIKAASNLLGLGVNREKLQGDHQHAHILTLPDGHRRIAQIIVWTPGGLADDEVEALCQVRELYDHARSGAAFPGKVHVLATAIGGNDLLPRPWVGNSDRWVSVTPYVPTGHSKNDPLRHLFQRLPHDLNYVHPGFTDHLASINTIDSRHPESPPVMGVFQRQRPKDRRRHLPDVQGHFVELRFGHPVAPPAGGLLTFGQLSHYGLGLFRPAP